MKEKIQELLGKLKAFWERQSKRNKIIFAGGGTTILILAILAVVLLNRQPSEQVALFPGMTREETQQVYAVLQERGVPAELNRKGELLVQESQWDNLVFELAGMGYPKTTPNYDFFLNNTGFTTTEYEQKQILLFQLQTRMEQTLAQQAGIESATVSFNIPETSNYIWDQNNKEESTAAIQIRMKKDQELSPERVQAVKNLAAFSVPNLKSENVVVIDMLTGVEMLGVDATKTNNFNTKRLEFERQIAKQIEDNVKRLLTPKYGINGVTAVAQVELDYDMMKTEQKQYVPEDDGKGVMNHFEERFTQNGQFDAGGLVGEENNTDIPRYPNQVQDNGDGTTTDYENIIDYDISYVLTQIERGEPLLRRATVAVVVNDAEFTTEREETLVELISKSTNIAAADIKVSNLDFTNTPQPVIGEGDDEDEGLSLTVILIIAGASLLLLIILAVVVIILIRRARKRKELEEEAELENAELERQKQIEREIAEHKRMLQDEAKSHTNAKDDAIAEEVRAFAEQNPEVTANLIRAMLREES